MFNPFKVIITILLISILTGSCTTQTPAGKTEEVAPALTPVNQEVKTIPPTLTPTPMPTITPTLTPTTTPLPSPTPRPKVDQAFIDSISHKCDEAFNKRVSGGNLQIPLLTLQKYEEQWYNRDYKIPFAETKYAEGINSLVCIMTEDLERGTYEDGAKAYQQRWKIRLVNLETGDIAGEKSFAGDNPPNVKIGRGDAHGSTPDKQQINTWIFDFLELPVLMQQAAVDSLVFSPDGLYLAIGAGCDDTRLWNLKKMQSIPITTGEAENCYADNRIDFSPDGSVLSYFDDGYLEFKVFSGKFIRPNLDRTGLQSDEYIDFSPDGSSIAVGGYVNNGKDAEGNWNGTEPQGTIFIYDMATGEEQLMITRKPEQEDPKYATILDNLLYSPDGQYLVTSGMGQEMVYSPMDGALLFSLDTGYLEVDNPVYFGAPPETMYKTARGIAFSPDGETVALSTANGEILIYSTKDWIELFRFPAHAGPINALAFSPDGSLLASGGADGEIMLWQVDGWTKRNQFSGHLGEITTLAFSLDGGMLASGSMDKTVYLWDLSQYQ